MRRLIITSWDEVPVIMDLPMAARIVGQTVDNLQNRAKQGGFPAYREGREWRVEKEALKRHIERNRNGAYERGA